MATRRSHGRSDHGPRERAARGSGSVRRRDGEPRADAATTMKIIGAGFSRTGTFSLKRALEIVGLGPCYHMDEVFRAPHHVEAWRTAGRASIDWRSLFAGYARSS